MVPRSQKFLLKYPFSLLKILATTFSILVSSLSVPLIAADEAQIDDEEYAFEEIIVTASRTGARDLQKTAIAITALTSDLLKDAAISNLRDVGAVVPGLQVTSLVDFAQIYLRGVGSNNVFAGTEASVGFHQDGVYVARPAAMLGEFLDVERIEVLRGPQGTLYGRNSTGGTVNIISRRPSTKALTAEARLGYGNYDLATVSGYVNGPITNGSLAGSLSFLYLYHDDFRVNLVESGDDVDSKDSFSVRGQLLWDASENISLLLRGDFSRDRGNSYGFDSFVEPVPAAFPIASANVGNFDQVTLNFPQPRERDNYGISLQIDWQLSDTWSLTSLTAYRDNYYITQSDSDVTEANLLRVFIAEDQNQFSEEVTLHGNMWGLDLLVGVYYFNENIDADGFQIGIAAVGIARTPAPIVNTEAIAAFTNLQYTISERLTAEIGLRYSRDKKAFDKIDGIFVLNADDSLGPQINNLTFPTQTRIDEVVTPKFGLNYQATDDLFLYTTVTRGFKGGGFNFTAVALGSFKPEFIWAYEVGAKASLLDNTLIFNTSAFYYDYSDLQVQAFIRPGTVDITNAASANIMGIEVESRYAFSEAFEFTGQISFLSASYADFPGAALPGGGEFNASGNWLNNAPQWSGNIGVNYQREIAAGVLYSRVSVSWTSRIFFTADNNFVDVQESYALVDASLNYRWADEKYEIGIWARNILDKQYISSTASFPVVRAGRAGDPATVGIQFAVKY